LKIESKLSLYGDRGTHTYRGTKNKEYLPKINLRWCPVYTSTREGKTETLEVSTSPLSICLIPPSSLLLFLSVLSTLADLVRIAVMVVPSEHNVAAIDSLVA
jgi:hypothetical protein